MINLRECYVVDSKKEIYCCAPGYEDLEELESIRAYDAAKASGNEAIPFKQAVAEIGQNCKWAVELRELF